MQDYTCSSCNHTFSKDDVDYDEEDAAESFLLGRGDTLDASVVSATFYAEEGTIGNGSCTCIFPADIECPNCAGNVEVFVEAEIEFHVGENWEVDEIQQVLTIGVTDANETERVEYHRV